MDHNNMNQFLRALMQLFSQLVPQQTPAANPLGGFQMGQLAQPYAQTSGLAELANLLRPTDVTGKHNLGYVPGAKNEHNPFDSGFFMPENRASSLLPEARLASQGPSAMNQWAQLGGMSRVDSGLVDKFNAARANPTTPGWYAPPQQESFMAESPLFDRTLVNQVQNMPTKPEMGFGDEALRMSGDLMGARSGGNLFAGLVKPKVKKKKSESAVDRNAY